MKCLRYLAAAALVAASGPAFSQLYIYAGAGGADPKFKGEDFLFAGAVSESDTKDSTYHLGIGYRFSRHWAAEVGFAHLGEYGHHHTDFVGDTFTERYEVTGVKLAVVGIYPATERFSLYGKLGIASTKVEWEGSFIIGGVRGAPLSADHSRNSLLAGFGAQYNITDRIGVRGEFENWGDVGNTDTGRARMSTVNLLGVFTF